jgi:hypothetical protein
MAGPLVLAPVLGIGAGAWAGVAGVAAGATYLSNPEGRKSVSGALNAAGKGIGNTGEPMGAIWEGMEEGTGSALEWVGQTVAHTAAGAISTVAGAASGAAATPAKFTPVAKGGGRGSTPKNKGTKPKESKPKESKPKNEKGKDNRSQAQKGLDRAKRAAKEEIKDEIGDRIGDFFGGGSGSSAEVNEAQFAKASPFSEGKGKGEVSAAAIHASQDRGGISTGQSGIPAAAGLGGNQEYTVPLGVGANTRTSFDRDLAFMNNTKAPLSGQSLSRVANFEGGSTKGAPFVPVQRNK